MELNFETIYRIHIAAKKWAAKEINRSDPFAYARKKTELQQEFKNCGYSDAMAELHAVEKLCQSPEKKAA